MSSWQPVYIGVGSNLNEPVNQVQNAIEELAEIPDTMRVLVSTLVHSPPLGECAQPDYINAVVALVTQLAPESLLDILQRIESEHGRTRSGKRWDARTLDLDILVFGARRIATERLTVPHPHLHERSFVLGPLNELAPDLWITGLGAVRVLAQQIDFSELQPLTEYGHRKTIGAN
ncbi:MAG: 2-amino-4-hydroxy-6-hydroxymethyldihydropteridine diphosphokinase [Gammaproteobacteria bacterium]|nr:2-amino-4-hydroxy-6-hydroxymethyldihydropteridine diphosphokinase [Gammaproteobacteria bacterium]